MNTTRSWRRLLLRGSLALSAVLLLGASGCELRIGDNGTLDLRLTDAPLDDADEVVIAIEAIEIRDADGERETFSFSPPRQIDLVALSNGRTTSLLSDAFMPSGDYASIRLRLRSSADTLDSYVRIAGRPAQPLYVPDAGSAGLQIAQAFTVEDGERLRLTLDFDLRRSLREPDSARPNAYRLLPALRLVEDRRSGSVRGRVAPARLPSGCTPVVYVYAGRVTPDDIGSGGAEPLSSAPVQADGFGNAVYTAAFLPAGEYTLAFTCDARDDDPSRNDSLDFVSERVTVERQQTATLDF